MMILFFSKSCPLFVGCESSFLLFRKFLPAVYSRVWGLGATPQVDRVEQTGGLLVGRIMVTKQGKSSIYSSMGSAQTATPTVEDSLPSIAPETVSIDRVEYEQFLAHKASQSSAFSAGPSTSGAGTPAIAVAIGIGAAIDSLSSIGMQRITMIRWSHLIVVSQLNVVDVLNPLAREYKSIGTVKKEVAELQEDLAEAHKQLQYTLYPSFNFFFLLFVFKFIELQPKQAHISEARVSAALGKLAFMEELMNESVVQKQNIQESDRLSLSPSTSSASNDIA
ncbi:hypothetical protein EJ110_NYTH26281 [Nymphaea thermarum]|nr:hypothetical protein EJ110_NYTH26281 [Nymphaea thermarum]